VAGRVACDPDSTVVAFVHDRAVWTVWTDGTHLRRLHAGVAVDWLLEHVLAVASGGRSGVVWAVRDDGTTLRVVVTGGRRRGRNRCLTPRRGDRLRAIQAQWGDDVIFSASGADTVDGGSGDDIIRTGAGGDFIKPGPGRDVVDAGTGDDHVVANDGERDVVDCGPGDDRARVDTLDVVRNCEHVTIASP
jgi:Ca2+-binding RTX toxin-like protein